MQVWLRTPADPVTLANWENECGRGRLYAENKRPGFVGDYHQRVEFRQPSNTLLGWTAQLNHTLVNRVEVALDHVFANWAEVTDAQIYLHQHLVRRWHGKKQQIKIGRASKEPSADGRRGWEPVEEIEDALTRYDGPRRAANLVIAYIENYSRITGEPYCLHVEWRTKGARAVRGMGIYSPADLVNFDHRAFWQKRLRLVDVDPEQLGRLVRNRHDGGKSRTPKFQTRKWDGLRWNTDEYYGRAMLHSCDSMQELLDKYGTDYRIARIITSIPNEGWLPASEVDQSDHEGASEGMEVIGTQAGDLSDAEGNR